MTKQDTGLIDVEIPSNDDGALPLAEVVEGRGLAKRQVAVGEVP